MTEVRFLYLQFDRRAWRTDDPQKPLHLMAKSKDISVLAELDRYLLKYEWAGATEVKVRCPFHEDTKPSCSVSVPDRVFVCHAASCGAKGDLIDLLAESANQPRSVILEDLSTRYELDDVKVVDPAVVERWHRRIWDAGPLLEELRKRAITDDTIRARKLGEDGGRVTIPVPNQAGDWVNVRKYLPGAPGSDKMRNMRGRGSGRWYPADQLKHGTVLLVGGEMKALAAVQQLGERGVGAVSWTSEKRIPTERLRDLAGKSVYVCMDVDAAGRKAAHANLMALRPIASELHDLLLPLDLAKHPKGDVNDFVAGGGDLWEVMSQLQPWTAPVNGAPALLDPVDLHLADSVHARNAGIRVRVRAVAVAMDIAPYPVPKDVRVKCDRSQKFCPACPVWQHDCDEFTVPPEHPAVLMSVHVDSDGLRDAMVAAAGIPRQCRACEFETSSYYNAEDVRISPCLEITSRAMDQKTLPAICVGKGMEMNEPYVLTGRMLPHPRTQQSTLLISGYEQTQDALSTYSPSPDDLRRLLAFQPREWTAESLGEKLDHLYEDLERNVTRIRRRRDMHLVMDAVWHSPLLLTIDGRPQKGWLESLVVGDSEQGKSETAMGLMRHYGLGERVDCKNATAAGLMGGLQQLGNGRWFASWGILPMHDKRMVFLEELKGASVEAIGRLTDMRSSGVAELAKIEKRRTHARTRILAASNPRPDGRTLSSYSYGVEVIRELIGGLEDVRRFDLFYLAAYGDVTAAQISEPWPENGHATYGPDLCRELVLWTWTRQAHQCVLTEEVRDLCTQTAVDLSKEFTDDVPIIGGGSARFKVARFAAALAARTFSMEDDGMALLVRPCHVHYAVDFMRRTYSSPTFGMREFTDAVRATTETIDASAVKSYISALPFPYDFVEALLRCERVEQQDVMDWCSWDRVQSSQAMSLMVRKHALRRDGKYYRKTGPFIELLRSILRDRNMPGRPDHIPDVEF